MKLPVLTPPADDALRLIVFGPGYGESVLLGTAASGWIVIDSLEADDDEGTTVNPAGALLDAAGATWSLLMLTHPHQDHAAGMAELVNLPSSGVLACVQRFVPIGVRWDSRDETAEDPSTTETLGPKERALLAIGTKWETLLPPRLWDPRAGDVKDFGDISIECLWPTQEAVDDFRDGDNPNILSSAVLLRWRDLRLLLGADLLTKQWRKVADARNPEELAAHRSYKVAHHGSKGAVVEAFDGTEGSRHWMLTPWDCGRTLPRFELDEGTDRLLGQNPKLHLTALPFRSSLPKTAVRSVARRSACASRAGEAGRPPGHRSRAPETRPRWLARHHDPAGRHGRVHAGRAGGNDREGSMSSTARGRRRRHRLRRL